jgi:hypothetical protein
MEHLQDGVRQLRGCHAVGSSFVLFTDLSTAI